MIKVTLWMIFLAVASYCGFCLLLYLKQRSMLYYPVAEVRTAGAEVIYLPNDGHKLKIWHIAGSGDRALIYFGGNAEDVSVNIPLFKKIFTNYSVYLLNYRGYGGSSGTPSEDALFSDGLAFYDLLRKEYKSISVMGRSLGTGVAVYLASKRNVERMILVSPYDSMANLASSYYPLIPVSYLMKDKFDSVRLAAGIKIPTLAMIAEHDEVIPRKNSVKLVSYLDKNTAEVFIIKGAGHNNIGMFPTYGERLQRFMMKNL